MINFRDIKVFGFLTGKDMKEISGYMITERYPKRKTIFAEGDPSGWFYIVLEGKVKITKISQDGKELILEIIPPGDFFGGVAVLRDFPYPANAVSMEDTKVLKISRRDFMVILDRFPSVMYRMVQGIGDRMRVSHEVLKSVALEKVGTRIAALLIKLSERSGRKTESGTAIEMRLTKQDIAEMVGTTVETAIRTMSRFKKNGLISEKAGKIILKDIPGLRGEGQTGVRRGFSG